MCCAARSEQICIHCLVLYRILQMRREGVVEARYYSVELVECLRVSRIQVIQRAKEEAVRRGHLWIACVKPALVPYIEPLHAREDDHRLHEQSERVRAVLRVVHENIMVVTPLSVLHPYGSL